MVTAVDVLAAYRLTRLVTADVLTKPLRAHIIERAYRPTLEHRSRVGPDDPRFTVYLTGGQNLTVESWEEVVEFDPDPPKLATLVTCRWCTGVWVGFGVILARRLFPRAWGVVARGLALSTGAVWLARMEDD